MSPTSAVHRSGAGGAVRNARDRSWLVLACALALVCVYLVVWITYSGSHTYPRYRQLAPGAAASMGDEHYRVLALTAAESAASDGEDAKPAPAHAVWVIAEMQVTIDRPEDVIGCDLQLLGPDGRTWDNNLDAPYRSAPQTCDNDQVKPGVPYDYETIYQIPARYADQLRGVVLVNDLSAAPSQVIRPA